MSMRHCSKTRSPSARLPLASSAVISFETGEEAALGDVQGDLGRAVGGIQVAASQCSLRGVHPFDGGLDVDEGTGGECQA
jgi:hypothetical protein